MDVITTSTRLTGDILRSPLINGYSAFALPDYRRGVTFIADNLASFGRSVVVDGVKPDDGHRLDKLLKRRPNPLDNSHEFFRDLFTDLIHRHNGYSWIARDGVGDPLAVYLLDPCDVTAMLVYPQTNDGTPPDITTASKWYWHAPSKRAIPAVDMIHLRGNRGDGLTAYDPTKLHASTFEQAALINARTSRAMRRGTNIIGAVEIPDGATPEQQDEIVAALQRFRDPNSDRDVIVLTGGAKLNNQALNPQQLQLIEQQRETTRKIAQILSLDPVYLFDRSESKYVNNAEQSGQDLVRFTFRTLIELIEAELSIKLLSDAELDSGHTIKLNPDALLRGSTATQMAVVAQGVGAGLTSKNEGRTQLGLPADPSPESDVLLNPHAVASAPQDAKQ